MRPWSEWFCSVTSSHPAMIHRLITGPQTTGVFHGSQIETSETRSRSQLFLLLVMVSRVCPNWLTQVECLCLFRAEVHKVV